MSLQPCPECKKEISSHAAVCPGCGYPLVREDAARGGLASASIRHTRPIGTSLGIVMCVIGGLLILPRLVAVAQFYFHPGMGPHGWPFFLQIESLWHIFAANKELVGLLLLLMGILQLKFGTFTGTRQKAAT